MALPNGTLTFLLTDIEGSTRLWEGYPEQMRLAMVRHDVLIETVVAKFGGKVVKPRGEGDSRFAVFQRAIGAVAAAGIIQRWLANEPWNLPVPLRVRIGLHTGEVDLRDGDYYGSTVNRCARLRSVAHGGQTLISQVTFRQTKDELPEGISLRDLGEHKLRDLIQPEHIYQLIVAGLQEDFPALPMQEGLKTNLPLGLTSFIGREGELAEVKWLISTGRLVTITGAGGMGKTRLAIQAAPDLIDSFAQGVWYVDLVPLSNPDQVIQQVVSILGIQEGENLNLDQVLVNTLKDKSLLLIMDNCEHLLPAVSALVEVLLRNAPKLKILATSRQPLGIPGEKVWWIPSLTVPGAPENLEPDQLLEYESVKLFVERARATSSDFTFTRQNARAVAQICAHLDGLPLAIELAGARVRILTVEEIAARLGDRFQLLVDEHTLIRRQQTLRALVDWSYDLLSEGERALFRRLSVFSGSFILEAAEQVCSGGMIKPALVFDLLSRLIDKSFVMAESTGNTKRYRFQETIHQYSLERLKESKELGEFTRKHARFYLKIAEESFDELRGPRQAFWLPRLDADYDNLRAALDWMAGNANRKDMFLRMASSLWRFWKIRGYISEGRSRLRSAMEKYPDAPPAMLAVALRGAGVLAVQQGDYTEARGLHEKSLALYREFGDKPGIARQLNLLGEIAQFQGQYMNAVELYQASLALRYEISEKRGIAITLGQLGIIARDRGQYLQAKEHLEESLKLSREIEDKEMIALALKNLGLNAYYLCEYPKASRLFEESVILYHELNDRSGISDTQLSLGNVAKDQGDFMRAAALYSKCLEIKQEYGDRRGIALTIASMAEVAFYQGRYSEAVELTGQSLSSFRELGVKRGVVLALGLQAIIDCYQGDYPRAQSAAEECVALANEMNAPRPVAFYKEVYGLIAYAHGEFGPARTHFHEALDIFQKVGDRRNIAIALINLARAAYRQGDHESAWLFLNESMTLSRQLSIRWTISFVLEIMGLLNRGQGNMVQAFELFKESLEISTEQANQQGIANCLGALAGLSVVAKQPARAARLFAASEKIRDIHGMFMAGDDRKEFEQFLITLRDQFDRKTIETLWREGYSLTLDEIMDDLETWQPSWWSQPETITD
jgi:predicted ATPase/class 3 adenylate cyclase